MRKDGKREEEGGDMKKKIFPSSLITLCCFDNYLNDIVQLLPTSFYLDRVFTNIKINS